MDYTAFSRDIQSLANLLLWLSQSRRFINASYANQRITRINPRKFAKFAYSWHSRSKPAGLSSDFEKTINLLRVTMLFDITGFIVLCAMAISMWMALYLLARGFPNAITIRASIVLLSLSAFFFLTFNHIFQPATTDAASRAILLIVAMAAWFSLTFQFLPAIQRARLRWVERGTYLFAILAAAFLITGEPFVDAEENFLHIVRMRPGIPAMLEAGYQVAVSIAILYNLGVILRNRKAKEGNYFLFASVCAICSVLYSGVAIIGGFAQYRFVSDLFILIGIVLLGWSVARLQSLVQRRSTLQDFPVTGLTMLGLVLGYVFVGRKILGLPPSLTASVIVFSILTHSVYDLSREILERLRIRADGRLRKQLHRLEHNLSGEDELRSHLQAGLNLLVQTLKASGGFVALESVS
ncbi:MAG: hypothetical protein HFACDABA_02996 [Anaerolineales bacterium]|nr:hypothetical protein [Anaerolineales bacterium]